MDAATGAATALIAFSMESRRKLMLLMDVFNLPIPNNENRSLTLSAAMTTLPLGWGLDNSLAMNLATPLSGLWRNCLREGLFPKLIGSDGLGTGVD